jgi:amylosucrase
MPFGVNDKTGDARISGSLASLTGLESALEANDEQAIACAIKRILLLHGMILSFGGIPLLYYGDEIGTLNDLSFLEDETKAGDSRWMNRPRIDWERAERRHVRGTVEERIFSGLRRLISVRKTIRAFADFNNRELLSVHNPHLFVFLRSHPEHVTENVLVIANFDSRSQSLDIADLGNRDQFQYAQLRDLATGANPARFSDKLVIPPYDFYWLTD